MHLHNYVHTQVLLYIYLDYRMEARIIENVNAHF